METNGNKGVFRWWIVYSKTAEIRTIYSSNGKSSVNKPISIIR
jgi:hypothetical protein